MEGYLNTALSPEERARDLLAQLTLEEKMAQIRGIMPFGYPGDKSEQWVSGRGIGQVSALPIQMMETTKEQAVTWQKDLQQKVMQESPHHIPAAFHMEGVNGAYFHGAANYPTGISRGAAFDPELEEEIGKNVARNELAAGFTQVLAPVLDVARDPRMGRYGEAYGEDPTVAAALGAAYTRGIQSVTEDGRQAAATSKHFVGFHSSRGGVHGGGSSIGERELREIYAKPFQAAITESGLKGVMPCYNVIDGIPFSASSKYLTGLLREEMGFDGVTVSDYSAVSQVYDVKRVGKDLADAGEKCLKAGMDVELPSPEGYADELEQRFRDGKIDMAVLDRAVLRILKEKLRMGLFDHPFGNVERLQEAVRLEQESGAAKRAAEESVILLKNDGILPLGQYKKILLIGPHAANARFYFGGYTHLSMMESSKAARNTLAGVSSQDQEQVLIPGTKVQSDEAPAFDSILNWIAPGCPSLLDAVKAQWKDAEVLWTKGYPIAGASEEGFAEALQLAQEADLVLMTLGGKYGTGSIATMGEGIDATDIGLPACQEQLIQKVAALGKPVVGIHFGGKPISSDAADKCLNALIEAFCPGAYAAPVLVDILSGALAPSGKLPVSIPFNAGQIPVVYSHEHGSCWHQAMSIGFPDYVDCSHHPRYPFGYGLTYTSFVYEDLTLDKKKTAPDEAVTISFTVHNTGTRAATEIVQLYLADVCASVTRPVLELAGFCRIPLEADAKQRVSFWVHPSQMAFLDEDMRWKVEQGEIEVLVGTSSDDIRLTDKFEITEDQWIDGKTRSFYAEVLK